MQQFSSTKIIPLGSTAFRQPFAQSHCRFLHGYRLQAKFWFTCHHLDTNGWVVDFGGLGEVKKSLEGLFDHTTCISSKDPERSLFETLHSRGVIDLRIFEKGVGIERFAEHIFELVNVIIKKNTNNRCWLQKVEVWEHDNNSAILEDLKDAVQISYIHESSFNNGIEPVSKEEPKVEDTKVTEIPLPKKEESTSRVPPLYNPKTTGSFKDPFAGTSWGNSHNAFKK